MVEFAVVAPVLVLLVFGTIEFGRMVMVQQVLTNGAREGARLGILDDSTVSDVETTVNNYLTGAGINSASATVTVNPNPLSSAGYGDAVTVTVSIPFNQVSWLPTPMFLSGATMSASAAMRRETVE